MTLQRSCIWRIDIWTQISHNVVSGEPCHRHWGVWWPSSLHCTLNSLAWVSKFDRLSYILHGCSSALIIHHINHWIIIWSWIVSNICLIIHLKLLLRLSNINHIRKVLISLNRFSIKWHFTRLYTFVFLFTSQIM